MIDHWTIDNALDVEDAAHDMSVFPDTWSDDSKFEMTWAGAPLGIFWGLGP